jgi:hypothetical protein
MSLIAQKLISASGPKEATDDDFNLVTQLYHFDGSNGATNIGSTTFNSASSGSGNIASYPSGVVGQGTFSPFSSEEGKWSIEFDGSVYCSSATSDDFEFGTGDYTIEAWVWKKTTGQQHVYDGRWPDNDERILFYVNSADKLAAYIDGTVKGAATSDFPLNQWVHIALTRSGTTGYLFQNGSQVATWTGDSVDIEKPPYSIFIGRDSYGANYYWNGFMSNIRVLKGTAAYTGSSYSVPTSPLTAITNTKLLTARMNRFIDSSASAHVMTNNEIGVTPFSPFAPSAAYDAAVNGGSVNFEAVSSGYVADLYGYQNLSTLGFGTGDFTIEAWIYKKVSGDATIYDGAYLGASNQPTLKIDANNKLTFIRHTTAQATSSSAIPLNVWTHVAVSRASSTGYLLINGAQVGTWSDSQTYDAPASYYFFASNNTQNGSAFVGNMSVRILKGTGLYTGSYTVPTSPFTDITNTKVLLNGAGGSLFDQTGKTNLITVGNAQLDTSVKKFGTASAEFDGTGDRLVLSNKDLAPVGTQSFTIECFIYVNSHKNYNGIYSAGYGIQLYVETGGKLATWIGNASGTFDPGNFQSSGTISTTTWTHIALVRDSANSTLTYYINGTASGQTTSFTTVIPALTTYSHTIGSYESGTYSFNGFIDEFRITNKARYTSNFTAPTEEFPNL